MTSSSPSLVARSWTWLQGHAGDLRQAVRVMVGVTAAYALYASLKLPQGYWAVFTVIIVMQGSIGGTVGAAVDRMIGTVAGALVGGAAAALRPPGPEGLGVALLLSVGLTALAAAIRPNLKVAPVTAAIMLLSNTSSLSPEAAAAWRVGEIAVGAVIGVLATAWVFPPRSRLAVAERVEAAADLIARLLEGWAETLAGAPRADADATATALHVRLRVALGAVETAMAEAERQRIARLGAHGVPAAVSRTLWRARNDTVAVGRAAGEPLPDAIAPAITGAATAVLRAEAFRARACASALKNQAMVDRGAAAGAHEAFTEAFSDLRRAGLTTALSFEGAGRAWGLAFALANLHRDLDDLCDRVDEAADTRGPPERKRGGPPPDGPPLPSAGGDRP